MKNGYLPPRVLQIAGLILLIVFAVFWFTTQRESALLIGAAMALIGVGAYGSARDESRRDREEE